MTHYRAATSGHRYRLQICGRGEPLLMLHGFSGDCSTWDETARRLGDGFGLIAIDILGHGASDSPADAASYRMESVAADIIDVLDQACPAPPRLLGYSMGGRLALFLALRYPSRFRSVILESASPGLADEAARAERRRQDDALADRIEAKDIQRFVDHWEGSPIWASQARLPAAILSRQRAQRLRNSPLGLANSLRGMGAGAQPSLWPELSHLSLPTLLIAGQLDDKFRRINGEMLGLIPAAEMTVLESAGHNVHLEQPKQFCDRLRSFLQAI